METGSYGDGYRDARKHATHEIQIAVRNATADLEAQVQRLLDALMVEKAETKRLREALSSDLADRWDNE